MRKEIKILVLIGAVVVIAAIFGARQYRNSVQNERKSTAVDSPLVRPDSPASGPADAPVTLVEFLDPECESCREFYPRVKQILKDYDGKVRLVVRYMAFHHNSRLAATYTIAAGEQGKYWEMQELLFQRQPEWSAGHGEPSGQHAPPFALFERYAGELGLDLGKLRDSVAQTRHALTIDRDQKDGQSLGVSKTPTFFVNGRQLARFSEADLRSLIDEELMKN